MRDDERDAGSTFSGIGGFDLGLERAGWRIRWQAESDEYRRRVLAHHWPDVPLYADVRDVAQSDEESRVEAQRRALGGGRLSGDAERALARAARWSPRVDLVAGGFPCQDVSVAGKRAGLAGRRSSLFAEFARIADALRPRWLLIENVPGLLTSHGGRDFGVVLGTLADLGYGVAWRVLDSRYFGVAQRRRRVFIVGRLGGDGASALRPLCESCAGSFATVDCTWQTAPARTGDEPPRRYARGLVDGDVAAPLTSITGGARSTDLETATFVIEQASYSMTPESGQGAHLRASRVDVATGIDSTGLGATTDRGVRVATSTRVRRLTPIECERVQGFPDDWTRLPHAPSPDTRRYRALGDAVTVHVAEWIGRRLLACDRLDLAA